MTRDRSRNVVRVVELLESSGLLSSSLLGRTVVVRGRGGGGVCSRRPLLKELSYGGVDRRDYD
jgi:hypothetical protein